MPIIPVVLLNGAEGIGTGWSTKVSCYHPLQIIENVRKAMQGRECDDMAPWYRGFKGEIHPMGSSGASHNGTSTGYRVTGRIERVTPKKLRITELPIGKWTIDYKEFLESHLSKAGSFISDFASHHTDRDVDFHVTLSGSGSKFSDSKLAELLRLSKTIDTKNAHLFDSNGHIRHYPSPTAVIREFAPIRMSFYEKRKERRESRLLDVAKTTKDKHRFIDLVCEGKVSLTNKSKGEVEGDLRRLGFNCEMKKKKEGDSVRQSEEERVGEGEGEGEGEEEGEGVKGGYDHLLSLPLSQLTREKKLSLERAMKTAAAEYSDLKKKRPSDLWEEDLSELYTAIEKDLKGDEKKARERRE